MSDSMTAASPAFVCRCEELTAEDIHAAVASGARTINDVKRRTRAGMGICQGAYCLNHVARIVEGDLGQQLRDVVPMTARPPVRVITLGTLSRLAESE